MPLILGQILVRTVKLSDSFLASFLESGSLSNLSYATRITNNFHHLFAAIHIIYFPLLSKLNKSENSNLVSENKSSLPDENLNQDKNDLDDEIPF